ncbi:hypothetical protein [Thalassotalea sp. PLHSN55]|uniref:hypothetical protein n=1 Tax=Thalassotalea sp. PLHSN55 TaxID=3435888 RepID=UPI003F83E910
MGHGPSLRKAIQDKADAEKALQAEIDRVRATLDNSEQVAFDYIDGHTNGIILARDTQKPEIMFENNDSYTKFSEEYSLSALDQVIDGVVDTAKNAMEVAATDGDDPKAVLDLVGSIGGLIKSGLALAASSSTTSTKLTVTFSQFSVGDKNFAVYNAVNSGVVKAKNAWGNKEITLVAQTTVLAQVKADPNLTAEIMLQDDLNTVARLVKARNKEMIDAVEKGIDNSAALAVVEKMIDEAEENIKKDRDNLMRDSKKS